MKSKNTSEYILDTSREYSIYVCSSRAIPSIEDGLKNGQRIALWLLRNRAEKMKTSALSGLMAYERLYVHGDVSANNAIGLLAAPYKNNVPLIEGLGQFGSRVLPVDGIGAPRYTEVRRSQAAQLLLYRDLDLVPLEDNYDGSNKQPVHFLPLIPLVLLNGVEGVAVGWSTSIMPRKLKDLIVATQNAIKGTKINIKPYFERYDIGINHLSGNQWEFVGKCDIVDSSTVKITELPPGISVESFVETLDAMEENEQIVSYSDGSTETIDITVRFKRGSIKGWTPEKAIDFFKLREKSTERITVIDWGGKKIETYQSPEDVIRSFAAWRLKWYTTRFNKMCVDTNYELTYWKIIKALIDDGFTARLGKFANRAEMETDVSSVASKKKISIDDKQMDRVLSLATYRWTKDFAEEVKLKIKTLTDDIKTYKDILASEDKLKAVYLNELDEVKQKLC